MFYTTARGDDVKTGRNTVLFRFLADSVALVHAGFVVFVVLGGLLVLRWRRVAWVHIPAVAWGALIEFVGWTCPLTPLENMLRGRAGELGYSGGFVEHYVLRALYPSGLTRVTQLVLGVIVLLVNAIAYGLVLRARHRPSNAIVTKH
jgi:hypothetical protein